ncbi:MAG: hypothetical protein ACREJC_05590 [Tepidisphaeraceae bacterium]
MLTGSAARQPMAFFTHRLYFRRYQLNVAQYGEILIAEAFQGKKMGDSQLGYDILVSKGAFRNALRNAGLNLELMRTSPFNDEIRIQVKSKLNETPHGKATVVHCTDSNLKAMTNLAVVLAHPGSRIPGGDSSREGLIIHAWLMTRDKAAALRKKQGQVKYIRVNQLKDVASKGDLIDITEMLSWVADARIEIGH